VTDVPRIDALQQQAVDYQADQSDERSEEAVPPENPD